MATVNLEQFSGDASVREPRRPLDSSRGEVIRLDQDEWG
jgi:hypothetical protein